jgi:NifU-like protein
MDVADSLLRHQKEPRHLGKLVGADAVGDVGSIVVGDALRFYIKLEGERIVEARFQVFGATAQIPTASVLTGLVEGKTLDEALAITGEDVVRVLAEESGAAEVSAQAAFGEPIHALPPMPWALEALRVAVAKYRQERLAVDEDLPSPLVCRCYGIT